MKLRIPATPEEAQYAKVGEVEYTNNPVRCESTGEWLRQDTLIKMGATFTRDLPEVGDGKEYEYKRGDECTWPKPNGTLSFDPKHPGEGWVESYASQFAEQFFYAIPKQPRTCVVEGYLEMDGSFTESPNGEYMLVQKDSRVNVFTDPSRARDHIWELMAGEGPVTVIVVREGE